MTNGGNGKLKTAGLVLTFLVLFATVVASFAVTNYKVDCIKEEGSLLSRKNKEDIITIKSDILYIKEGVVRIENKLDDGR
jgi:hypothetical protein